MQVASRELLQYDRAQGRPHLLELGTGWYPTVPLSFWLCGVSNIVTIDIQPVLRREFFRATCESFIASGESGELTQALPWVKEDRVSLLRRVADREAPPAQLLAELGIKAVVKDARETGLESGSIDFFWSNGVLYEIPEGILTSIFAEFSRVASPTAVMSHYVLMKDPYADFDLSITPFNFLKYSDWTWNLLFNSPLQSNNRLRISDYRRIHESARFRIVYEHHERGLPADLDKIALAKRFQDYSRDELLITRSWIVSAVGPKSLNTRGFSPGWAAMRPADDG